MPGYSGTPLSKKLGIKDGFRVRTVGAPAHYVDLFEPSGVTTNMSEDEVRRAALPLGLVDVKVCAVDEVWSGLKLMIRKRLRGA